jgi:hypothetical protein
MNHETPHIYLLQTSQPVKRTLVGYKHMGLASVDCLLSPSTRFWAGGSSPQSGRVTFVGGKDMLRKGFRHSECATPVQYSKYLHLICTRDLSYIAHHKNAQTRAHVAAHQQHLRADRNQQRCPSNMVLSAAAWL